MAPVMIPQTSTSVVTLRSEMKKADLYGSIWLSCFMIYTNKDIFLNKKLEVFQSQSVTLSMESVTLHKK